METNPPDAPAVPVEPSAASAVETVLWEGAPPTHIRLQWGDVVFLPILFFAAAAVLSRLAGIRIETDRVESSSGIACVVTTVWLVGRLVVDPWMRRRTRYVLTEDWLRIETWFFSPQTRNVWVGAVRDVIVWRNWDDSGTLVLATPTVEPGLRKRYFARRLLSAQLWGQSHAGADGDDVAAIEVASGLQRLAELVRARIAAAKQNDAAWRS